MANDRVSASTAALACLDPVPYRRHGVASLAHCFERRSRLVEEDTTGSRKPHLSRTANEELSAERDRCRAISVLADSQLSAVS